MLDGVYLPRSHWDGLFAGRQREFRQRLITVSPEEKQSFRLFVPGPESPQTNFLNHQGSVKLKQSEVIQLEDVIVSASAQKIVLPFMPEYEALLGQVGETLSTPCNSALCSFHGYSHFLFDQLSLHALYERHASTQGLPMLFNFESGSFLHAMLAAAWDRPRFCLRHPYTLVRRLNLAFHNHHEMKRCQMEFLRSHFADPDKCRGYGGAVGLRRIYVSRTRRRRLLNEDDVMRRLAPLGFTRIGDDYLDTLPVHHQATLFRHSEVVVSTHGSQLTNIIFGRPDMALVELMKFSWIEPTLCCAARAAAPRGAYGYLVDWMPWDRPDDTLIHADIHIDAGRVEDLVRKFL